MIKLEFDCPYCQHKISILAEKLSPTVQIRCGGCYQLIPAGVFYDSTTVSQQTDSMDKA